MNWRSFVTSFLVALWVVHLAVPLGRAQTDVNKKVPAMTAEQASLFARLALKGIQQPFPNKPGDVWNSEI